MRVLRLGNSEDMRDDLPLESRAWHVAGAQLEAAVGEPVETVLRPIKPTAELPGLVDEWIEDARPDLVFLKVTWYWYAYESVPRRIERIFGRAGRPVARAGTAATRNPTVVRNSAFKLGRRAAHRLIGGDTPYPAASVLDVMEATVRRVLAHESIALLVKGTGGSREQAGDGFYGPVERFAERKLQVEGGIERFCDGLGVPYIGTPTRSEVSAAEVKRGDGIHRGELGHGRMGMHEGESMVAAWRAFNARG